MSLLEQAMGAMNAGATRASLKSIFLTTHSSHSDVSESYAALYDVSKKLVDGCIGICEV